MGSVDLDTIVIVGKLVGILVQAAPLLAELFA